MYRLCMDALIVGMGGFLLNRLSVTHKPYVVASCWRLSCFQLGDTGYSFASDGTITKITELVQQGQGATICLFVCLFVCLLLHSFMLQQ